MFTLFAKPRRKFIPKFESAELHVLGALRAELARAGLSRLKSARGPWEQWARELPTGELIVATAEPGAGPMQAAEMRLESYPSLRSWAAGEYGMECIVKVNVLSRKATLSFMGEIYREIAESYEQESI